jgi:hypothetical protein
MTPAKTHEAFAIGTLVERYRSPHDSLIKDGMRGRVTEIVQALNGELGYFVRFSAGAPPVFCAASRVFSCHEDESGIPSKL